MKGPYLESAIRQFAYYKSLGEKTMEQLPDEGIFWQPNRESNSVATLVKHLHGNMLSRWTDFLTTDGEKEWRDRDGEFEPGSVTAATITKLWQEGWCCLFEALDRLEEQDLSKTVYIRNQGQSVMDAINRQLCHYSYHVGQIVYIGKIQKDSDWKSLSIPRNKSKDYNSEKFSKEKHTEHFTDEFLKKKNE